MPYTVPPDNRVNDAPGHLIDHTNISDLFSLLATSSVKNTAYGGGAKGDGTTDDTAALNAAFAATPYVIVPPGTYKYTGQLNIPYNSLVKGCGVSTVFAPANSAAKIYFHNSNSGINSSNYYQFQGGRLEDFLVDGTNAGANAVGVSIGDAWGIGMSRVVIQNFTGTSAIGLNVQNDYTWTEKARIQATLKNCTKLGVLGVTSGASSSMEYSFFDFDVYAAASQSGITIQNGAYLTGSGLFRMVGNFAGNGSGPALTITGTGGLGSTNAKIGAGCQVQLNLETAATSSPPQTINFGSSSNGLLNCFGSLIFGGNAWTASNAVAANIIFGGIIQHDSVLTTVNTTAPDGWL